MLERVLCATLALVFTAGSAFSQTYRDASGTIVPGVVPLPYAYTPLPPGQHNLAPITASALNVPSGARYATVCASGSTVRYTTDGITTPTATLGQPLLAGSCLTLSGSALLTSFRAASPLGTLDVEYFQ